MLRLTVDEQAWRAHVHEMCVAVAGLVPVVKGNGYGLGRARLAALAAGWAADEIAVGSVHELADVCAVVDPHRTTVLSMTPAMHLPPDLPVGSVLTVGAHAHVDALERHGVTGPVAVKLESSMHRHGTNAAGLAGLLERVASAGLAVHQHVLHLPLPSAAFADDRAMAEVERWLPALDRAVPLSLSHLSVEAYRALCAAHPDRSFRLRAGTALWHGDKTSLRLSADVLDVRPVHAGEPVGYRQRPAAVSGHLVMVGAGSVQGVVPLDGDLSPFHHARQRMPLAEPPHMHTSMVLLPRGAPLPVIGEWVDVQRPLISVTADVVEWR